MDLAIPEHVQQNLASIQADLVRAWQTNLSAQPSGAGDFGAFLNNAVGRASTLAGIEPGAGAPGFLPLSGPGFDAGPSAGLQAFMAQAMQPPVDLNPENTA